MFDSVKDYLTSQVRSRPVTFKEIEFNVDKSRANVWRELNTLLLYGEVKVLLLRFNDLDCPFYTLRRDVSVQFVKGGLFVEDHKEYLIRIG